jgi:hypothetical protein
MSDFKRLIYIVKELDDLLVGSGKICKTPIKILKEDILRYFKDKDYGIEIDSVYQSERRTECSDWKYKYECPICDVDFYRKEHNLFGYLCNECRRKEHDDNRKELFF